jgi:hypothetical protein
MSITLFANPGDTIRHTGNDAGSDSDRKHAAEFLVIDQVYTIKRVQVGGFWSRVWVEGVDQHMGFNTLLFDEVEIDPILAAARAEFTASAPMATYQESIVQTIYAVRALLKQVIFDDARFAIDYGDDEGFDIGVMLMSSAVVGSDVEKLVEFTGLPKGDMCGWHQNAVRCGLFTDEGQVTCGWFQEDGMAALLCDILTVQGILDRI